MFFLQMSGFPGSGKSTLARLLSKKTGAIIIDHDIVKSSLLKSLESNKVAADTVGKISYDIEWAIIDFHLSQGLNVIFDSPCFYTEMVEKGVGLSKKHNVRYKYVECYLNDIKEIQTRLKERTRMISQVSQVNCEIAFQEQVDASKKPINLECLVVDSGKPIDSYIDKVVLYINNHTC
ncbi:ATP-binding protein [Sporosarcina sp. ANT_H38]|uniref:AAA family ATPase n=1 Tax=Sporosarcina sp. ANT_H38 TaxID=2597358 RepID=UPI0011F36017|nr:AAA family ATPase [Sporosarcina sp. ANT_H38]KAA0965457.1 ATP-binding protein [Sporosarcina sp. ANT_H38]